MRSARSIWGEMKVKTTGLKKRDGVLSALSLFLGLIQNSNGYT